MLRVVLDTNVIISGVMGHSGSPYEVLQAFQRGEFVLLTSESIMDEVARVLARPFFREKRRITDGEIAAVLELLRTDAVIVVPQRNVQAVMDDPDDDRILDCALEGGTEYLVSGDHHLLKLRHWEHTLIVNAAEFLGILAHMGA